MFAKLVSVSVVSLFYCFPLLYFFFFFGLGVSQELP